MEVQGPGGECEEARENTEVPGSPSRCLESGDGQWMMKTHIKMMAEVPIINITISPFLFFFFRTDLLQKQKQKFMLLFLSQRFQWENTRQNLVSCCDRGCRFPFKIPSVSTSTHSEGEARRVCSEGIRFCAGDVRFTVMVLHILSELLCPLIKSVSYPPKTKVQQNRNENKGSGGF